jgi:hypothetical protein
MTGSAVCCGGEANKGTTDSKSIVPRTRLFKNISLVILAKLEMFNITYTFYKELD